MSASPTFTVHEHSLESDKDLRETLQLSVGTKLVVLSCGPNQIVLQRQPSPEVRAKKLENAMAAIERLKGSLPDNRTPEWLAKATERKRLATEHLEKVYASKCTTATELKQAERAWELADDELDFGRPPHKRSEGSIARRGSPAHE